MPAPKIVLALALLTGLPSAARAEPSPAAHAYQSLTCPQGLLLLYGRCQAPAGPGRKTLYAASWGAAFETNAVDAPRSGPDTFIRLGAKTAPLLSPRGASADVGTVSADGRYQLPAGDPITVTPLRDRVVVQKDGVDVVFQRTTNGLRITLAGEHIVYERTVTGLRVSGPAGLVEFARTPHGIRVSSDAGETRVEQSPLRGQSISGVALGSHPYAGRLATFVEAEKGVVIDVWRLAGFDPGAVVGSALLWDSMLFLR